MGNEQKTRYKLIKQVGAGDYAKVYAAEDVKLGRKVAIKQLHSQYMDDEDKLARYWAEAKLLLDLEHPNIMTIYDVVKTRGRLVLELMQGSLKQIYGKKPMPIPDVRQTIKQAARGLACLHENGIIHGDIKPANLMLSRTNVVKLGDFGLARRASDDEGSMLKGTTKYMAPELVSDEFGPVGPASDLYSLGFSALELMVGPDFDSLFPDLVAFGRDKQMAWMMWHCSADRRLPVKTVLDGVPEELANVIEKLTSKDQSNRYKTANEVVADLSGHAKPVGVTLKEEEAAAAEIAKKRKLKRRLIALSACVMSLLLSGMILFWPKPIEPVARKAPPPVEGVVKNVLPFDDKFVIDIGGSWEEYELFDTDIVSLNRKKRQLRDLKMGDRVVINTHLQPEGPDQLEVIAFRPEHHTGIITEIKPETNQIALTINDDSDDAGSVFDLLIEEATAITINEQGGTEEAPLGIADLKQDDSVVIDISDDLDGMVAIKIDAIRQVQLDGVIRKLSPRQGTMTIADTTGTEENLVTLRLDPTCTFSLNGTQSLNERLLTANDIQIGDRVTVMHDVKIKNIDAYRPFEDKGSIRSVAYDSGTFMLKSQSATQARSYTIGPKTQVLLGGEQVGIDELRAGDDAQLVHDSPDDNSPTLLALNAERPKNKNKWAILIANQEFDSGSLAPWEGSTENVEVLKTQLTGRFGLRDDQVKVFENESRVTLEQELGGILGQLGARDELYVYCATRSFVEKGKGAYLAAKDFVMEDMPSTGMELGWLIDTMDACNSGKKVLFLDCPSESSTEDGPATAAEMIQLLKETKRGGYPKFTYVLANAQPGDNVGLANGTDKTAFGTALAEAFAGKADRERDTKVEITELSTYVSDRVAKLASLSNQKQSPILFTPDNRPPRLSDRTKADIIALLSTFSQQKIDADLVMNTGYQISNASGDEPEPMLATGIILIKAFKMDEALEVLDEVRLKHRQRLLAHQGVIWIHLYKRRYDRAAATLAEMLEQIPVPEDGEAHRESVLKKIVWAGAVRELAGGSAEWLEDKLPDTNVLARCDELIASHGEKAKAAYESGRKPIREKIDELTLSFKTDPGENADLLRNRVKTYNIPVATEASIQEIRDGLDEE